MFGAFSGTTSQPKLSTWIIDSGATDHMTNSSHKFITCSPCPSNKKISTADVTLVRVAGQGDIKLNSNITLKNVLHIPRLTVDLISVKNFIKDLGWKVTFSHYSCIFQDQGNGKMIGLAKEKNGLYLDEPTGQNSVGKDAQVSFTI